jgi:hypothetical protein
MDKSIYISTGEGSAASILAAFLQESVGHMIPWLVVSAAVILCDLVVGIRKSWIMKEEVRFSSACRRTMGKMVSYFMFVIMVAAIDVAAGGGGYIDKWACLAVCLIEFSSIMSNILRPKGYDFNMVKLLSVVFGKKFDVDKKDIESIITNNQKNHETN